jgi:hypothetical protein
MRSRAIRRIVRKGEQHLDKAIGAGSYAIQETPILIGLGQAASMAQQGLGGVSRSVAPPPDRRNSALL